MAPHADNGKGLQEDSHPAMMAPLNPGVPNDAVANGRMPRYVG